MEKLLSKTERELKLANYSPRTIKSYLGCIRQLGKSQNGRLIGATQRDIEDFILDLKSQGRAPKTLNLYLNAIKYFYREILGREQNINIKFSKVARKLPIILSGQEIFTILETTRNLKHNMIISLAYGAGFRVSEVASLKVRDIDFQSGSLHLKDSKGRKDRITVLPESLRSELFKIVRDSDGKAHVFTGTRGGKLTTRTLQKVFSEALRRSGVKKMQLFIHSDIALQLT